MTAEVEHIVHFPFIILPKLELTIVRSTIDVLTSLSYVDTSPVLRRTTSRPAIASSSSFPLLFVHLLSQSVAQALKSPDMTTEERSPASSTSLFDMLGVIIVLE